MSCFYNNCNKPVTYYIKSKTHYGDVVYAELCDDHIKLQSKPTKISRNEYVAAMVMES